MMLTNLEADLLYCTTKTQKLITFSEEILENFAPIIKPSSFASQKEMFIYFDQILNEISSKIKDISRSEIQRSKPLIII
jgi:hypothetical protein